MYCYWYLFFVHCYFVGILLRLNCCVDFLISWQYEVFGCIMIFFKSVFLKIFLPTKYSDCFTWEIYSELYIEVIIFNSLCILWKTRKNNIFLFELWDLLIRIIIQTFLNAVVYNWFQFWLYTIACILNVTIAFIVLT